MAAFLSSTHCWFKSSECTTTTSQCCNQKKKVFNFKTADQCSEANRAYDKGRKREENKGHFKQRHMLYSSSSGTFNRYRILVCWGGGGTVSCCYQQGSIDCGLWPKIEPSKRKSARLNGTAFVISFRRERRNRRRSSSPDQQQQQQKNNDKRRKISNSWSMEALSLTFSLHLISRSELPTTN